MQAIYNQAVNYFQQGKYAQADELCSHVLLANPEQPDFNQLKGVIEFQQGKISAAVCSLHKAVTGKPTDGDCHYHLGIALHLLGRGVEAVGCYQKAIELHCSNLQAAWNNLGGLFYDMGQKCDAAVCYQDALAINSGFYPASKNIKLLDDEGDIFINPSCKISPLCSLEATNQGTISIKKNSSVAEYARLLTVGGFITIGQKCSINTMCIIYGHGGVRIGDYVRIAAQTIIISANHNYERLDIPICQQDESKQGICIGDDVWIGAGCKILDGVEIGRGCVIGAGSVVTKSISDYSVAVGVPAKVIKNRKNQGEAIQRGVEEGA